MLAFIALYGRKGGSLEPDGLQVIFAGQHDFRLFYRVTLLYWSYNMPFSCLSESSWVADSFPYN